MQSIGNYAAHIQRQKRAVYRTHRRAFGAQRFTTPEQRARYVAESIELRRTEGRPWTWSDYGLDANPTQQALVLAALKHLR